MYQNLLISINNKTIKWFYYIIKFYIINYFPIGKGKHLILIWRSSRIQIYIGQINNKDIYLQWLTCHRVYKNVDQAQFHGYNGPILANNEWISTKFYTKIHLTYSVNNEQIIKLKNHDQSNKSNI